ncbi:polysaccharide biosynthesis/export family protein [Achromobacter seleniivolatilans]|uniref:Polysaccharide biosynthesis/export family protein n=1 Tax=Achromobacter seleniivolatilans TaxID=3047478 RepID=A0ABY9M1C8_9BURK|nr:polysaccharide biosynthesis/export family protein [Achromobacter sp. R39]WMD20798.1 polysaccharide biosynthesis/export family protein [Achromobacter sp. R39]
MSAADGTPSVQLVEVTPEIAAASRVSRHAGFPEALLRQPPIDPAKLVAGDGVDVTIWEKDGFGMFPAGPSGASPLGEVLIDQAGYVSLPYLGRIRAAGETLTTLREVILHRLQGLIIGADVLLRATDRNGKLVVIQGDVAKPGAYPIEQTTRRLSGLLGMAAPNPQRPEQLSITHIRNGQAHAVRLADIYRDPSQDIALYPEDKVIAAMVEEHVVVLGAAGAQGRLVLSKRNYSVIDALGEAHGMNDATAHPKGVYVLRQAETAEPEQPMTLYHFDLTRPDQMGSAGMFRIADGDLLYISDAPFTKVQKVMSVFGGMITGAGNSAVR